MSSSKDASEKSTTKIPLLMWAFTLVLALGAGVGGYIIGERAGKQNAVDQIVEQLDGEGAGAEGADGAASGAGDGADQAKEPPVKDVPDNVEAGTDFSPAKKQANGYFDATINGPGAPVKSRDEIANTARRDPADPMAQGALDAPVVIAEFTDWECPYCIRHAAETEQELIDEYVSAGLVRIEWNDMPTQGPNSVAAAKAGRAAAEQGMFSEYKKLYMAEAAERGGHPGFAIEDYVRFAANAGVPDLVKFREDAEGTKYDEVVKKSLEYAQDLGVTGTPGFVVNTEFVGGALPVQEFRYVINGELKKVADKN
nr:Protein-disulfide isomerase [Streptococcus thermophilus]